MSLKIECDEMWSYVGNKDNKLWIWLAIDQSKGKNHGKIVGCHVGDRSELGARKLWESLPAVYQQCAVSFTDMWEPYKKVFPQKRHHAVGKETGLLVAVVNHRCGIRMVAGSS